MGCNSCKPECTQVCSESISYHVIVPPFCGDFYGYWGNGTFDLGFSNEAYVWWLTPVLYICVFFFIQTFIFLNENITKILYLINLGECFFFLYELEFSLWRIFKKIF